MNVSLVTQLGTITGQVKIFFIPFLICKLFLFICILSTTQQPGEEILRADYRDVLWAAGRNFRSWNCNSQVTLAKSTLKNSIEKYF